MLTFFLIVSHTLSSAGQAGGAIFLKSSDDLLFNVNNRFFRNRPDDLAFAQGFTLENLEVIDTDNVTLRLPAVPDTSVLTNVLGVLSIRDNFVLKSVSPSLDHLQSIGEGVSIRSNARLDSVSTLNELEEIVGPLNILVNDGLKEITGFDALRSVSQQLSIFDNGALEKVAGFDALQIVGTPGIGPIQKLEFTANSNLISILGFNMLTSVVGSLEFNANTAIQSIEGFSRLRDAGAFALGGVQSSLTRIPSFDELTMVEGPVSIGGTGLFDVAGFNAVLRSGSVSIARNPSLLDVSGVRSLNSTFSLTISENDSLETVTGFDSLVELSGVLKILNNPALTNLPGLGALEKISLDLIIENNPSLTDLSFLSSLTSVDRTCTIDPPELLENAPENVKAACGV